MQEPRGYRAIKQAFSSSDLVVLFVTFFILFIAGSGYWIISGLTSLYQDSETAPTTSEIFGSIIGSFFGGLIVVGLMLLIGMFTIRMMRQTMLGNSLEIKYSDYAWLRDWVNETTNQLNMPYTEVFVTQDPYINAYSFGYIKPYCVVLHSGSIRYLTAEELKAVVVHELGHIKYGHVHASVYLLPFLQLPIIGQVFNWISGFWQRRAELTADRLALTYMGSSELVKSALIKVHVGPDVATSMNDIARQWLQYKAERPMNHLAQTFSSHPFLVRRISHLNKWGQRLGL